LLRFEVSKHDECVLACLSVLKHIRTDRLTLSRFEVLLLADLNTYLWLVFIGYR
jgi:hypothetical protein